jgi:tRNA(Arg) A34 adenosine deaminase TadA
MCAEALSFVGVKRVVYAALAEDANAEQTIIHGLTLPKVVGAVYVSSWSAQG